MDEETPEVEPEVVEDSPPVEKIVLKDAHKIRDPRAKTKVRGLKTVLAYAANQNIQIIAGKTQSVPNAAVLDLVRTGCILRPPRFKE